MKHLFLKQAVGLIAALLVAAATPQAWAQSVVITHGGTNAPSPYCLNVDNISNETFGVRGVNLLDNGLYILVVASTTKAYQEVVLINR